MKRAASVLLAVVALSGCGHCRCVATSETLPVDAVRTRNRYRLFQLCVKQDGKYVNLNSQAYDSAWATFKATLPDVFADDGKPIEICLDSTDARDSKYGWTVLFPFLLSAFTLPMWSHAEWRSHYSIRFKKPKRVAGGVRNTYAVKMECDLNMSCYTPLALLFPYADPPACGTGRTFFKSQAHTMGEVGDPEKTEVANSAIAYGAACTLKRLEEDGALPDIWEESDVSPVVVGDPPAVPVVPVPVQPNGGSASSGVVEIDSIPL